MTLEDVNAFCGGLAAASHAIQWGGADVWKVGPWEKGKVFLIAGREAGAGRLAMSFKVSDISWEMLRDAPGCRPAPYLASRGMKWIEADAPARGRPGLKRAELEQLIRDSHALAAANLPKRLRAELGL